MEFMARCTNCNYNGRLEKFCCSDFQRMVKIALIVGKNNIYLLKQEGFLHWGI